MLALSALGMFIPINGGIVCAFVNVGAPFSFNLMFPDAFSRKQALIDQRPLLYFLLNTSGLGCPGNRDLQFHRFHIHGITPSFQFDINALALNVRRHRNVSLTKIK